MGNAAVTTPQRGTQFDPGAEEAGGGLSLFGVTPARALKIPLKHWQLSLGLLVVCGGCGFLLGAVNSSEKYKSVGKLVHQAKEEPDIPPAKSLDTLVEESKKFEYFTKINKKFDMGLSPELWARFFDVKKPPTEASIIMISLEWPDRVQGAELVNYLMTLHQEAATEDRKKQLSTALANAEKGRVELNDKLDAARNKVQDFLDKRGFKGNDPKQALAGLDSAVRDKTNEIRKMEADNNGYVRDKNRLQLEMEKLEVAQQQAPVKPDKEVIDPEYEKEKAKLKKELRKAEQELDKARTELINASNDFKVKERLYQRELITKPNWEVVQTRLQNAQSAVKGLEKDAEEVQAELTQLRPGIARLREARKEVKTLNKLLEKNKNDRELYQKELDGLVNERQKAVEIERAWYPLDQEVKFLEKQHQEVGEKREKLQQRLRDVTGELRVSSPATPSLLALSDRKKQTAIGFVIPLLLGLGLIIGMELRTTRLRAEVMADRLRLPILAESDSGSHGNNQKSGLSPNQSRALSLRIRQFVPGEGATVLVSSLNEKNGVDPLVTDLARYFAMRNEHVLILDARIAHAQTGGLGDMIDRRVDGQAPEVVPWVDGPEAGPGVAGLVQYLVFEGQSYTTFAYHTRIPGVDYMPAGGPYTVTDALASEPMDELFKTLRKVYTVILVIGPAVTRDVDTEILAAYVDGMVLVLNNPLATFSPPTEQFVRALKQKSAPLLGSVICV